MGFYMGGRMEETGIELRTSCFDTMLNYRLSQKLKLLEYGKFNHLTTFFYQCISSMNKLIGLSPILF